MKLRLFQTNFLKQYKIKSSKIIKETFYYYCKTIGQLDFPLLLKNLDNNFSVAIICSFDCGGSLHLANKISLRS